MGAAPRKDPAGRPEGLCAYQICASCPDAIVAYFIAAGGVGGAGGGGSGPAFTQVVQHSLRQLDARGLVRNRYMDTRGLSFDIKAHRVILRYPVMAVYQYASPVTRPGRSISTATASP